MNEYNHLHLTAVDMRFAPDPNAGIRPVIQSGAVHLTNEGFDTIVREAFREEIRLPFVTLRYVHSRLVVGGAEITVRVQTGIIDRDVRSRLAVSLSERGNLRMQVLDVRAGLLPVTRLLEPLLGYVDGQPGLSRTGSRTIEVDFSELLRDRNVPLELAAPLRWVSVTPDALTLEFG